MNTTKITALWLMVSLTATAQPPESADIKPRLRQLGFGIGYQGRQLIDEQKSALVYISKEYNAGLFYKSEKEQSLFSVNLDFSTGSFDAKHFKNRNLYSDDYNITGSITRDSVPVISGILAGQFQLVCLKKLPVPGNTRWFAGASLRDWLIYPENNIGLLNSLSLNAILFVSHSFREKQKFGAQLVIPLLAANTRLPWHNTSSDPVQPETKTFFKKGTRLVTVNNFQSLQLNLNYTCRISSRWNIGAEYTFTWLRIPYYQPMKSFVNRIQLFTAYNL